MRAKQSPCGLRYFAHDPHAPACSTAGESLEHHRLKQALAAGARAAGHRAELEAAGPGGRWRADVLATCPRTGRRTALEAQLSPLIRESAIERTGRYRQEGVEVVWFAIRERLWQAAVPSARVNPDRTAQEWRLDDALYRFTTEECYCDRPCPTGLHSHWAQSALSLPCFLLLLLTHQLHPHPWKTPGAWVPVEDLAAEEAFRAEKNAARVGPALRLRPDLATVMAGFNDLIRPGFDAARATDLLEEMFAELTAAGAHVVTVTYPDIGRIAPLARPMRPRVLDFNAQIRSTAARYPGVTVVDTFPHTFTTDARMWSSDRLHASPLGHARFAAAVAHALNLPGSNETWTLPLPPQPPRTAWQATGTELRWIAGFGGSWIYRRLRGRSSGDGHSARRPELAPVTPQAPG
ncbi:competence protein CoiA family protein [Streptomyces sp. 3N207]|uniref:competence protein CoiA family protein n=1 Tax=Streptomyces sp. 3N207 TaxID=3457417 RepID=UPI003FD6AA0C